MAKKKRAERERTSRRAAVRREHKLAGARVKLAQLEPGGAPGRPIEVESASVIEPRAESFECAVCSGASLRCEEHLAAEHGSERLRMAKLRCPRCGARRDVYFRIVPAYLN